MTNSPRCLAFITFLFRFLSAMNRAQYAVQSLIDRMFYFAWLATGEGGMITLSQEWAGYLWHASETAEPHWTTLQLNANGPV